MSCLGCNGSEHASPRDCPYHRDWEPAGPIPTDELEAETAEQCARCLRAITDCRCETAGARTPRRRP